MGRAIQTGLAALVPVSALAIGGVHPLATGAVGVVAGGLALAWLLRSPVRGGSGMRRFVIAGALLCSFLFLQTLPLPPSVLGFVSPRAAELVTLTQAGDTAASDFESTAWTPLALHPFAARSDLVRHATVGIVLLLAAVVPAPLALLTAAFGSGVAIAMLAIVQAATWNGRILWFYVPYEASTVVHYPRLTGPFVNADHFAAFLAMLVAPGAALLLGSLGTGNGDREARLRRLALHIGGIVIVLLALLGSASRAGIAAAAVGAAILGARMGGSVRRRSRTAGVSGGARWAVLVLFTCLVATGALWAPSAARSTLEARLGESEISADLGFRVHIWRQSARILHDFRWLGVGSDGWAEVFRRYQRFPVLSHRPNHAHNDYLEWAAEVGLVGVLLTIALAIAYFRWAAGNRDIPPIVRFGLVGGIAAIVTHEVFDMSLRSLANAVLAAVLLGLLCNRNWRAREVASARPWRTLRLAAVAVSGLVVAGSAWQLAEAAQWLAVRSGATKLSFAPANAETWYELGLRLEAEGRRYDATTAAAYREATLRRPDFAEAWWRRYRTASRYEGRHAALRTAVALHPTSVAWRLRHSALLDLAGRHDEALAEIEEAAYRDPRLWRHPYLDPRNGSLTEPVRRAAMRGFRRALAEHPDEALLLAGVAAFEQRFASWIEAGRLWNRAASVSGDWTEYGPRMAEAYSRAGKFPIAEHAAQKAIEASQSAPEGYRVLALSVLAAQHRYDEAARVLDLGIRRVRDAASLWEASYQIERRRGRKREAIEALETASDLRRGDANLQLRVGNGLLAEKDYHRALIAFDRAIAADDRRPEPHRGKGAALDGLYRFGEARKEYERASGSTGGGT